MLARPPWKLQAEELEKQAHRPPLGCALPCVARVARPRVLFGQRTAEFLRGMDACLTPGHLSRPQELENKPAHRPQHLHMCSLLVALSSMRVVAGPRFDLGCCRTAEFLCIACFCHEATFCTWRSKAHRPPTQVQCCLRLEDTTLVFAIHISCFRILQYCMRSARVAARCHFRGCACRRVRYMCWAGHTALVTSGLLPCAPLFSTHGALCCRPCRSLSVLSSRSPLCARPAAAVVGQVATADLWLLVLFLIPAPRARVSSRPAAALVGQRDRNRRLAVACLGFDAHAVRACLPRRPAAALVGQRYRNCTLAVAGLHFDHGAAASLCCLPASQAGSVAGDPLVTGQRAISVLTLLDSSDRVGGGARAGFVCRGVGLWRRRCCRVGL
jgi:hypothetical protein